MLSILLHLTANMKTLIETRHASFSGALMKYARLPSFGMILTVSLALISGRATAQDRQDFASTKSLRLIPFPKEVRLLDGQFALDPSLVLEAPAEQMETLARQLNDELRRAGLTPVKTRAMESATPSFRLAALSGPHALTVQVRQDNPEAYGLEVRHQEIVCRAPQPVGLCYGLQTLCQLIRANRLGNALPCLQIHDWPSLRWRCFQDDMTR
ncbi:MAG: glycoside hydrolase family 20 zincin-like fold domain-containing protein [Verrucomicrobia bacterium]|nr:glycoside hydrolase family 20 zincin-like fold domain-containing protein [Verrucomicrobiota bacterium]